MSLTSYRAAPPRVKLGGQRSHAGKRAYVNEGSVELDEHILFVDLAATYSPVP